MITRKYEELLLAKADGSCVNGKQCISPTIKPGTAVKNIGKCVLCCRFEATKLFDNLYDVACSDITENVFVNPYNNIDGDYDVKYYLDALDKHVYKGVSGPFIRYNSKHYKTIDNKKGIEQLIPNSEQLNWLVHIIDMNRSSFQQYNEKWYMIVCQNSKCRENVLSILDQQNSVGLNNTVFNLGEKKLLCGLCKSQTTRIDSKPNGLIEWKSNHYTKCAFCSTNILFNSMRFPQACSHCTSQFIKKAQDSLKICCYCNIPVNVNRRNGGKMITTENGTTKYYCKIHFKK